MIVSIATDLILCLSACKEVPTGDRDVIDLNLSYDQVILGLRWHWRLPNTYNLREGCVTPNEFGQETTYI